MKKRGKSPLILIIALESVAAVLCLIIVIFIIKDHKLQNGSQSSGTENQQKTTELVLKEASTSEYDNGDYTYTPADANITYDAEEAVIYYNNVLIVYLTEEMSEDEAAQLAESVDGKLVGYINGAIKAIQIQVEDTDLAGLQTKAEQLMESGKVLFASYDFPIEVESDTVSANDQNPWGPAEDTGVNHNGNEDNPDGNDWWAESIGAYTAWNYVDNLQDQLADSTVGIIDNGFDCDHQDFLNEDGTSAINLFGDNSEADHGTHVAGVIGARNNSTGIRGIDDYAQLYCIDWNPITNDDEDPNYEDITSDVAGFLETYSTLLQFDRIVVNNSYGKTIYSQTGYAYEDFDKDVVLTLVSRNAEFEKREYEEYLQAEKNASANLSRQFMLMISSILLSDENKEFLIVQSAGNGYDNSGTEGYDAAMVGYFCGITESLYDMLPEQTREIWQQRGIGYTSIKDHILIVSGYSKDAQDTVDSGFNYGDTVDICAPGKNVYSTISNNAYESMDGTSMSAPIVTGSAALLWSIDPTLTAAEVKACLIDNADTGYAGNANDSRSEYPMLNLGKAVTSITNKGFEVSNYYGNILTIAEDLGLQKENDYSYSGNSVRLSSIAGFEYDIWDIYNEGNTELTLYGCNIGNNTDEFINAISANHAVIIINWSSDSLDLIIREDNLNSQFAQINLRCSGDTVTSWTISDYDEEGLPEVVTSIDYLLSLDSGDLCCVGYEEIIDSDSIGNNSSDYNLVGTYSNDWKNSTLIEGRYFGSGLDMYEPYLTLNADGTVDWGISFEGGTGTYTVNGDKLILNYVQSDGGDNATVEMDIADNGNTLYWYPDGTGSVIWIK